jgi:hypothetical protein
MYGIVFGSYLTKQVKFTKKEKLSDSHSSGMCLDARCESWVRQGNSSTKLHIRIVLDCGSWPCSMAAADADDGLFRLPQQETGGSVLRFVHTFTYLVEYE